MIVVKGVEVSSLTLIWEFWGIANHISVVVVPSVVVVSINSLLMINSVNEDVVFTSVLN